MASAGEVEVEVRARLGRFEQDLRRVEGRLDRFDQAGTRGMRNVESATTSLNRAAKRLVATFVTFEAARRATSTLANFAQEMSTVRAITGATEAQFASLTMEAQRLGATTRFSASDAASGLTFLARAGFEADEALGSLGGTLRLAQAGGLDLGSAADIASNILTGFRLEVQETSRVVDVLALAANSSNTNVFQLGEAMKFVAPVAAGLGVSVEEAAAAIGALSDAGLQGSLAGTGLRRVLSELESPSQKTRDILASVGVTTDEVRVSTVGLQRAMARLAAAGIDTGQALEIFGDRGGPAFEVLSSSIPRVNELKQSLDGAAGTAERIATIMDDNLNGALLAVRSATEAVVLSLGELQGTALEDGLNGLASGLRFFAENADTAVTFATAFGVALAASKIGAVTAIPAVRAYAASVALVGPAAATATAGLTALRGAMALATGPLGIAVILAGAATVAFDLMARQQRRQAEAAQEQAARQETANEALQIADRLARDSSSATAIQYEQESQSIGRLGGAVSTLTSAKREAIESARQEIQALDDGRAAAQENVRALQEQAAAYEETIRLADTGQINSMRAHREAVAGLRDVRAQLQTATVDATDLERGLQLAREALRALYSAPPEDFEDPINEAAVTASVTALQRRLQITSQESELQRRIASALLDANLQLDSQTEEATQIRDLVSQIYNTEMARHEAQERQNRLLQEEVQNQERLVQLRQSIEQGERDLTFNLIGVVSDLQGDNQNPLSQLEAQLHERLEIIRAHEQAVNSELINYEELRNQIVSEYSAARNQVMLSSASQGFGSLAQIVGAAAGETSAAYKVLFGISKGFAIAESIIAIQQAIAKAMAVGFPANVPLIAQAAAQGASIVNTIVSTQPGFADGGYVSGTGTGRSDSISARLSNGEFVVNAASTKANRGLLEAINSGSSVGVKQSGGVQIYNYAPGVKHEAQIMDDGRIRVIAREEVAKGAGNAAASDLRDPNSKLSKSMGQAIKAPRNRS